MRSRPTRFERLNSHRLYTKLETRRTLHWRVRLGVIVPVQNGLQRRPAELVRATDHTGVGDHAVAVEHGLDNHGSLYTILNRVGGVLDRSAMEQILSAFHDFLRRCADREIERGKAGGDDERAANRS